MGHASLAIDSRTSLYHLGETVYVSIFQNKRKDIKCGLGCGRGVVWGVGGGGGKTMALSGVPKV